MKITFVHGNNWIGMYVDGKLVAENHSSEYSDVLEALKMEFQDVGVDNEWLEYYGSLPSNLSDVVLED